MAEQPEPPEPGAEEQSPEIATEDAAPQEPAADEPKAAPSVDPAPRRFGPAGEEVRNLTSRERGRLNRRELLKLAPVVAIGAFAIPKFRNPLLMTGLHFSDWASAKLFGPHRLEPTYSNRDVAPFSRFPYNYYDVLDPGVDLATWTLTVEGLVQRPGDYTLQQIQALPKVVQNTRHVCVEGWDVVGNFGGTRASDFLRWHRRRSHRAFSRSGMRRRVLRVHRHGDHAASADALLLRDVWPAARPRARRATASADAHQDRLQAGQVSRTRFA